MSAPRDCVVIFCLLGADGSEDWLRTPATTFTEASKRAAHYGQGLDAYVLTATRYVLDRWPEVPIDPDMTALMYRRTAPLLRLVSAVRRRVCPN